MRLRIIIPIIILVCSTNLLSGQTYKQYTKKATEAFNKKDYSAALAYNRLLLSINPENATALFYGGESARHLRAWHLAESMLWRVPDTLKKGDMALCDFQLGLVKKGLKKYEGAAECFQKFYDTQPNNNPKYHDQALEEIKYCEWALENLENAAPVEIAQYDTLVNSVWTDFAPLKVENTLYYSSMPETGEDAVSKIYASTDGGKGYPIAENSRKGGVHTSNLCFGQEGNRMYYTLCKDNEEFVTEIDCQIWRRERSPNGSWGKAHKLPPVINRDGYTTTQPAVGWDEGLGKEILYFSSNRPGGKGEMDIWYSLVSGDSTFSAPTNIDSVNTAFDELSPYFHKESNCLFFSSLGHNGFGGLDIFRSLKKSDDYGDVYGTPQNIGQPINSSYDDLYYVFDSEIAEAHFASNRKPDAMCADTTKDCTCDDIFHFSIEVDLDAYTFNELNNAPLTGVYLELKNLTDGITDTIALNNYGNHNYFRLVLEKEYQINATKEGYENASVTFNTKGIVLPTSLKESLYLKPKINVVVLTFDAISKEPLNGTTVLLRNETGNEPDRKERNSKDSNRLEFPLDFDQEYSLTAAKKNYSTDQDTFSTVGYTEPTSLTRKLYLTPFVGLPLTLYFDNDRPRYRHWEDTITNLNYGQTFQTYLKRRNTFIYSFSAGLKRTERNIARDTVRSFFKNEVQKGYEDLQKFSDILIQYLDQGNKIEIIIEGYASPIAGSEYNKRLTGRRISSVINQFRSYRDGALAHHIDSNRLIIREAPKGEDAAPEGVIDDPKQRRHSVYSPSASRERRVRILDIRRQEDILSAIEKE